MLLSCLYWSFVSKSWPVKIIECLAPMAILLVCARLAGGRVRVNETRKGWAWDALLQVSRPAQRDPGLMPRPRSHVPPSGAPGLPVLQVRRYLEVRHGHIVVDADFDHVQEVVVKEAAEHNVVWPLLVVRSQQEQAAVRPKPPNRAV